MDRDVVPSSRCRSSRELPPHWPGVDPTFVAGAVLLVQRPNGAGKTTMLAGRAG